MNTPKRFQEPGPGSARNMPEGRKTEPPQNLFGDEDEDDFDVPLDEVTFTDFNDFGDSDDEDDDF